MAHRGDVRALKSMAGQRLGPLMGQLGAYLRTRLKSQLLENPSDVGGSRMLGDYRFRCDLAVGKSASHGLRYLLLAPAERG